MTDSPDRMTGTSRMASKWQIPLLLLGVVAFGIALVGYLLSAPGPDWETTYQALTQQVEQVADGDYAPVAEKVRAVLHESVTPKDQPARRGRLHRLLGDIYWRTINATDQPTDEQWASLRDHYTSVLGYSEPPTADVAATIAERIAAADAALGDAEAAIQRLSALLQQEAANLEASRRGDILLRLIELQQSSDVAASQQAPAEVLQYIDTDGLSPEQYGRGVGLAVDLMLSADRYVEADELVQAQQTRKLSAQHMQHLNFHRARVLAARGLDEQADNVLIGLCGDLQDPSPLLVRCQRLRGELIWQDNPSEAVDLFNSIIARAAGTPMAVAARAGLAKAYGRMGLVDRSLAEYETTLTALAASPSNPWVDLPDMARRLEQAYYVQMADNEPLLALRFVEAERVVVGMLAVRPDLADRMDLVGRVAAANRLGAEEAEAAMAEQVSPERRRELTRQCRDHLSAAADALVTLADLAAATEAQIHGDSLWTAAELYDRAGDRVAAIDILSRFVASHNSDERVPGARFQLGQAMQAEGRYDDAIVVYQANLDTRVPSSRHIKAVEGLIPMAMCYVAKGEEFYGEAEKILHSVVAGRDEVTPTSALYRKALFALGRLYYRREKWRQARKTLDEAVQRDPGQIIPLGQPDPTGGRWRYVRATRSMYFIAESYCHSARDGLQASANADHQQRRQLKANARAQLSRADQLYQKVIDRLESLDGELDELDNVFRRNSYFARGDCMYELGRYEDALDRYSRAVHKFQHRPEALGGLIAMYNCYAEMGRTEEADACHERAAELAKHLEAIQADPAANTAVLDQWDRWLETVKYLNPDISDEGQS